MDEYWEEVYESAGARKLAGLEDIRAAQQPREPNLTMAQYTAVHGHRERYTEKEEEK